MKRYESKHVKKKEKGRGASLALILTLALFVVTIVCGVSFARYATSRSGSSGAAVARFDVSAVPAEGQANAISLEESSDTATYSFNVTSNSEVTVNYDIIISWQGTWPNGVTMKLDEGDAVTPSGTSHTFSNAGSFTIAGGTNPHTLSIAASDFDTGASLSGINVQVVATQVD